MKSTTQRRAALVALLLAPTTAACGFSAQTDEVYQPGVGVNDRSGPVDILNATIVSATDGSGTFAGTLVNEENQPDQLTLLTGAQLTSTGAPVPIPPGGMVNLADSGAVTVSGDSKEIVPGNIVEVTLVFSSGQSTKIGVPVVSHDGYFANVPVPSGS